MPTPGKFTCTNLYKRCSWCLWHLESLNQIWSELNETFQTSLGGHLKYVQLPKKIQKVWKIFTFRKTLQSDYPHSQSKAPSRQSLFFLGLLFRIFHGTALGELLVVPWEPSYIGELTLHPPPQAQNPNHPSLVCTFSTFKQMVHLKGFPHKKFPIYWQYRK